MTTGQNAAAFLVLLAAAGAIAFPAAAEDAKPTTADPTKSEQMSRERAMKSAQKIVDTFRSKKRGASLGMTGRIGFAVSGSLSWRSISLFLKMAS